MASLTERERQCLRLVARDRGSGEIATILGLAIGTVENHIKNARAKLSGVDRFTAARMLAAFESRSQSLASWPTDIVPPAFSEDLGLSFDQGSTTPRRDRLHEDRAIFTIQARDGDRAADSGEQAHVRDHLSPVWTLLTICLCAIAIAILIIAAVPISDSFQRLANGLASAFDT